AERAKEIGVRKINGAGRSQLIVQFLGESLLQCGMAGIAALLISSAVLPLFNQLAGKTIAQNIFQHGQFGWLVLASISLGLLAGMYPAIVLSSLRPAQVLKGQLASGSKGVGLRRILVVGQFTIAIMLMAGTLIVYRQVHFMVHQPLGFDKENMLVIDYRDQGDPRIVRFQQALTGVPGIRSSSLSSSLPGYEPDVVYSQLEDRSGAMQTADLDAYFVDVDFLTQYQIPLVAGRGFSRDYPTDCPNAMVINEAAVAKLGYGSAKEAIGKRFSQQREGLIIGVVKDFHFQSLQQAIQPLTLRIEPNGLRCHLLAIHVAPRRVDMARVEQLWDQYFPERPFTFTYLQDSVDRQYDADQRLGQLCLYLSILAIVISCLGLLGLSSYSTLVRTKEIGIRKVFGASVTSIVRRLTRDFVRWVAVAFLVATPIAWYTMHQWLRHFAYQAPIGWGIYVSAGMLAVLIASLTVSVQAIKAARANPLRCLRTE
ncbi:MAG TPA: FtsX-like permease family protein, partial [Puia sp.]